jgi:4-hydroxy-tetrahydrodipicolinate synthase
MLVMHVIGRPVSRLSGYAPALPTPFREDGTVVLPCLERFCHQQIDSGATALIVCGTTGEAPALTLDEKREIVSVACRASRGRVPVVAGAGSNSTDRAIELAAEAERAGADAVLSVVPYYNKPGQNGLLAHFHAVADAIGIPIILHDVPSRTVVGLADATVARLAENPRFIGLMDSTEDPVRPVRMRTLLGACPDYRDGRMSAEHFNGIERTRDWIVARRPFYAMPAAFANAVDGIRPCASLRRL